MWKLFNSSTKSVYDLLIIADDRDAITKCIQDMRHELLTISPRPTVKHCRIFDYDREKHSIDGKNVVFMLSTYSKSLHTMVPVWLDALGIETTSRDRYTYSGISVYLVINHDEKLMTDGTAVEKTDINVINVATMDNGKCWWPWLLLYCFPRTKVSIQDDVTCFMTNSDNAGEYSDALHNDIECALRVMNIELTNTAFDSRCCVVVTGRSAVGDANMDVDVLSAVRSAKVNGCVVHVVSTCNMDVPPNIKWVAHWTHTYSRMFRFWLWLLIDLELIDVNIKRRSIVKPRPPQELKLRRVKRDVKFEWRNTPVVDVADDRFKAFVSIEMRTDVSPWKHVVTVNKDQQNAIVPEIMKKNQDFYFRVKVETEEDDSKYVHASVFVPSKQRKLNYVLSAMMCAGSICPPLFTYPLTPLFWIAFWYYRNTGNRRSLWITSLIWSTVVYVAALVLLSMFLTHHLDIALIISVPVCICSLLISKFIFSAQLQ